MERLKLPFKEFQSVLPKCSEREIELYNQHFRLLQEWNENIALVSRKSIGNSFESHYVDSLFISDLAKEVIGKEVVRDLGSGAGFPGFIFAIRNPETPIILYERIQKKKKFLQAVQEELKLPNIRIEGELPHERMAGVFLARAVMPKEELFPYMGERMRSGAILILNRGGTSEAFIPASSFKKISEKKYTLPKEAGSRVAEAYRYAP